MTELDDIYFLTQAYEYAAKHATDPSTQNGAVILYDDGLVFGANHFPKGVKESEERWADRSIKLEYIEHAERNAVYTAAKLGIATEGTIMYCPWFACTNCARAIIQAGIKEVVGLQKPVDLTPDRWKSSIQIALDMLVEAGVKTRWVTGRVGVVVRFNGELVEM